MISPVIGGRYRLEHELERCGMGTRYLATDLKAQEAEVAVTVMRPEVHATAPAVARLRAEARVTRLLRHPHIARVHAVQSDAFNTYLVTEYPEGQTLDALLQDTGQGLALEDAVRVIDDLCAALLYAHAMDVVHGDVQPATVYITPTSGVKLVDFGMMRAARLCHEHFDVLSVGGRTMAYSSVEMLEGREPDPRDDVYSLACVLYTVLSGAPPFGWHTAVEARGLALEMPPLTALSAEQNAALARALAFERAQRTPGVNELLADLGWACESASEPAAVATSIAAAAPRDTPADAGAAAGPVSVRSPATSVSPIPVEPPPAPVLARYRVPVFIVSLLMAIGIGIAVVLFWRAG